MQWQVMLAQQESIAQLMGVYDGIRARGDAACGQSADAYVQQEQHLDALQQEHQQGKRRMKKERWGSLDSFSSAVCRACSRSYSDAVVSTFPFQEK